VSRVIPIASHRSGRASVQADSAWHLAALPPLTVYVHLPWCLRKCPYCDFNSHAAPGTDLPEQAYIDAVFADLEAALPQVWGRRVHAAFIGGGTPSLFSPDAIGRLIDGLRARLPFEPGCEITLEANPGTFETDRFRAFRQAGVTRLSIGVQSFDDGMLAAIGRVHNAAQARAAVAEAAMAFDTFNLDLMYGLPGQSVAQLESDIATALDLQAPHVSIYHLTIEAGTQFALHPPALPDDEVTSAMLDLLIERLGAAGRERYEVSAFARPGHRCVHNLNYWEYGDYLGAGAGAHSKISFPDRIVRQQRWREPQAYMQKALDGRAVSNETPVLPEELPFEFMLNALRLAHGVPLGIFAERTGLPLWRIQSAMQAAQAKGLLARSSERLAATALGFDFLSDLQAMFLPSKPRSS
jgi:oxygen-independent coproporphyrinogen-3 oxidase